MRFLLDMPVSQRTASWLRVHGHDVLHAREVGLAQASDVEILQRARQERRVIVTMDLDFPHLLSMLASEGPGVILIRLHHPTPLSIQSRLEALLNTIDEARLSRSIAVLEESRIRLHQLPTP